MHFFATIEMINSIVLYHRPGPAGVCDLECTPATTSFPLQHSLSSRDVFTAFNKLTSFGTRGIWPIEHIETRSSQQAHDLSMKNVSADGSKQVDDRREGLQGGEEQNNRTVNEECVNLNVCVKGVKHNMQRHKLSVRYMHVPLMLLNISYNI